MRTTFKKTKLRDKQIWIYIILNPLNSLNSNKSFFLSLNKIYITFKSMKYVIKVIFAI